MDHLSQRRIEAALKQMAKVTRYLRIQAHEARDFTGETRAFSKDIQEMREQMVNAMHNLHAVIRDEGQG